MNTASSTIADQVAQPFPLDVDFHVQHLLHNDNLYRHVKFAANANSTHWFELITSPGMLTIRGDMGTYVFANTEDMFTFFETTPVGTIDPGTWSRRVTAAEYDHMNAPAVKTYSKALVRSTIESIVTERVADAIMTAGEERDFRDAVDTEVLTWVEDERELFNALEDFQYGDFSFEDFHYWETTDYTYHFLWCLHAIRWGIHDYREAQEILRKYGPGKDTA